MSNTIPKAYVDTLRLTPIQVKRLEVEIEDIKSLTMTNVRKIGSAHNKLVQPTPQALANTLDRMAAPTPWQQTKQTREDQELQDLRSSRNPLLREVGIARLTKKPSKGNK
jgi:hypothetical protein